MSTFRQTLKRLAPPVAKSGLQMLRAAIASPEIDTVMLNDYIFEPEESHILRLNLLIPSINQAKAFGGVLTGIEIYILLAKKMREYRHIDLRIILDDFEKVDLALFSRLAGDHDLDLHDLEIIPASKKHLPISTRRNDIFITYNFWLTVNLFSLLRKQSEYFGCERRPYVYLIQEYEPHMFHFSSTHMVARQAYDEDWPMWGIFNSSQLFNYFTLMGHRAERSYVFEPVLNSQLRPFLADLKGVAKKKQMLVYGRPVERNCFSALARGLQRFSQDHPEFSEWEIISAGSPHPPIALANGRQVRRLGKLSLSDYGKMLRETAVGVSLQASPHPSYPPLEMAHFGILTVTNSYTSKDLGRAHDNIISIPTLDPMMLGGAVAIACARFEEDPKAGAKAASHSPAFLSTEPLPIVNQLALDVDYIVGTARATTEARNEFPVPMYDQDNRTK